MKQHDRILINCGEVIKASPKSKIGHSNLSHYHILEQHHETFCISVKQNIDLEKVSWRLDNTLQKLDCPCNIQRFLKL